MKSFVPGLLLVALSSSAAAQVPNGSEFRVNTYTTGDQENVRAAVDAHGNMVVVWASDGQDGDQKGVFGRLYDPSGTPRGAAFQVNTYTTGDQSYPSAAWSADGTFFLVVWQSWAQDGFANGVFERFFSPYGVGLGPDAPVNTWTTGDQYHPRIATDSTGQFVVTWYGGGPGETGYGIFARRLSSGGALQGSEFRVNTYTTG